MTWGPKHIVGILAFVGGGEKGARPNFFGLEKSPLGDWGEIGNSLWVYLFGAHLGHLLDFSAALLCYLLLYADGTWMVEAKTWQVGWVSRIFLFNLALGCALPGFWHWFVYKTSARSEKLKDVKLNQVNQYEPSGGLVGMFFSSTGNLEREITFTTLGWLQSAAWQVLFTHLWAAGYLPYYADFWSLPARSILIMAGVTYWREIHFYHCHRAMHPWFDSQLGLLDGDVGAFLYRHVHSLHHKSYNPGPWSGLCMHPVEHLLYYSCATIMPFILYLHPLHFLYCKFHADIAPVGGHDGYDDPGPNGDFHYLHHAKFECNYGVPWPFNFDKLWGTWVDPEPFKKTGEIKANGQWANKAMHNPLENGQSGKSQPLLDEENKEQLPHVGWDSITNHKSKSDCWVVLYGRVIDVSDFLDEHPGGAGILLTNAAQDATDVFESIHAGSGSFSLIHKYSSLARVVAKVEGYTGPEPPAPAQSKSLGPPGVFFMVTCLVAALAGTVKG